MGSCLSSEADVSETHRRRNSRRPRPSKGRGRGRNGVGHRVLEEDKLPVLEAGRRRTLEADLIASIKSSHGSPEVSVTRVAPEQEEEEEEEKCAESDPAEFSRNVNTLSGEEYASALMESGATLEDVTVSLCDDEEECVFCMESFSKDNPQIRTLCECGVSRRPWHMMCLLEWLKNSPNCPVCRQSLFFEEGGSWGEDEETSSVVGSDTGNGAAEAGRENHVEPVA